MGDRAYGAERTARSPGFTDVLRIRAFGVLYLAETQSIIGDQLARVALAILVFRQTGSAAATALTYAATFLPAIVGGFVLSGIGDKISRRTVMVGCDLVRGGLFALMAVDGMPLGVMIVLLVLAVFLGPAFSGAEVGYLASALDPEAYRTGTALRLMTSQLAQVLGFAAGGALVVQLSPRGALVADAVTYFVSAACIALALPSAPKPSRRREAEPDAESGSAGRFLGVLWRDRGLRRLVGLTWLVGLLVVPEGLAVPLGREIGASTGQIGIMYASIPLGGAVGAVLLMKVVRGWNRDAAAAWMAAGAGLPLLASAVNPDWGWVVLTWFLSGALSAYLVEVTSTLAQRIPDEMRARLMGYVSAGLVGAQGVGLGVFGLVAQGVGPGPAIAIAGCCAVAVGLVLLREPRSTGGRPLAPQYAGRHTASSPRATPTPHSVHASKESHRRERRAEPGTK